MSADNGIYAIKYKENDYRVVHAGAIENLDYYERETDDWKQTVIDYFNDSKTYSTHKDVMKEAYRIAAVMGNDGDFIEYGVQYLGEYRIDFKEVRRRETLQEILNEQPNG
jgi:hypothetical protein